MTATWYMPTTWREDLGRARRLSGYSFDYDRSVRSGIIINPIGNAVYRYVSCKIERPDGTRVRAKVTSDKPQRWIVLAARLQEEIRKRYKPPAVFNAA